MHTAVDPHSRMVSDINVTLRLISFCICFFFWHSYLTPLPRKPAIIYHGREHYRQASGWYRADGFPIAELISFLIRLTPKARRILLCLFPYKDIGRYPLSNEPESHLFRTDAVHRCPKGLADYNLNFIFFSLENMCIIIPRL